MDKWFYGYWFKSKKKAFGWGWIIIPNMPQGYIVWGVGFVCCVLFNFPEFVSFWPQGEVMIACGAILATTTLITFLKTNLSG